MSIAVGFVCKENLKLSNSYTLKCKENIKYWSKYFPVYVLTNNISSFKEDNCKCLYDASYYSTFNRYDLINKLQKKYKIVIYLDCDDYFFPLNPNLENIPEGMHAWGDWIDTWGNLQKLDYFKIWKENIKVDDNIYFPWESVFILNTTPQWDKAYAEIIKCKHIAKKTEIYAIQDENPHHGTERCEAIGLYVGCQITNFPLHLNSKYAEQFYKIRGK